MCVTLVDELTAFYFRVVVGVGKYTERRSGLVIQDYSNKVTVGGITHPSPINPKANKDWKGMCIQQLTDLKLLDVVKGQASIET